VIKPTGVHINSEWVRQIQGCNLKFRDVVKNSGVTVIENHGNIVLEGQWVDIGVAVNDIKDAIAKLVSDSSDTGNLVHGLNSETLNPVFDRNNLSSSKSNASVSMNADRDQTLVAESHRAAKNSRCVSSSTRSQVCESLMQIDEHIWRHIKFRYPDVYKLWEQKLMPRLSSSGKVIEVRGQPEDVVDFDEWCKKHAMSSVVCRLFEIPSDGDVNLLKKLVDSREAAKFRVCISFIHNTHLECIGKAGDVNGVISWLKAELEFRDPAVNVEDSACVSNSFGKRSTYVNDLLEFNSSSASQVMNKMPVDVLLEQDKLRFSTAESQLKVEVLRGDLTVQKCEVIVNPANKHLLHSGGAAKAIQNAAGSALVNECKDYIRRHKELSTSSVMHTTSGRLPRPINNVIHACGPNVIDCPDDNQCLRLLEKTFLNCLLYANDTLHVCSIALPAISSGIIIML